MNSTISVQHAIATALACGTDEQIAKRRRTADRNRTVAAISVAVFLVGGMAACLVGTLSAGLPAKGVAGGSALAAFIGCILSMRMDDKYTTIALSLRPLAETSRCDSALYLVENHESARQVRDAIVQSGRQLYVVDFDAMDALTAKERDEATQQADDERRRAACARLHGMAAT